MKYHEQNGGGPRYLDPEMVRASLGGEKEIQMKTILIIAVAELTVGSALALHVTSAQQAGTKRTDLQRHDLSAPGREVIQSYAKKFSSKYEHRTITDGIGHNLPQETPQAFAKANVDVDRY
jgi:hypothetical protein